MTVVYHIVTAFYFKFCVKLEKPYFILQYFCTLYFCQPFCPANYIRQLFRGARIAAEMETASAIFPS